MPSLPDPATSAAVLIGCSNYQDPRLGALPGVVNNVADLADVLADAELLGLPTRRIATLLDCADNVEVIERLSQLAADALDTFLVYYSGHGLLARDGDLVLATPSARADLAEYTGLPYASVRDIVDRCRAVRRIVILDCCFSGRALRAMSDPVTAVIGQVDADGVYVLTSAPATSPSVAPADARHTAFTGGLLRILRAGISSGSELLTLDDVYDHTLVAMARHGWPRPQRLGTNTIGRLGFLRNRGWRRAPAPARPGPVADPGRHWHLAEGIRDAVAIVAPALGPTGRDGLDVLNHAFPARAGATATGMAEDRGREAGIALVRETMLAMREQYGDGATTAAVILGVLVDGLQTLLETGAEQDRLDTAIGGETALLGRQLLTVARPASEWADPSEPSVDGLSAAVRTALGRHEVAEAVVAAARSVGAGNVEVTPASAGTSTAMASTFVLDSKVLAPNAAAGPISLNAPLVVASPDGQIDVRALLAAAGGSRRTAILIIAPRVTTVAVRALLHAFAQVVVVCPTAQGFDLAALRDKLAPAAAGPGWSRARRALVQPTATTIDRPPVDLELSRNRIMLNICGRDDLAMAVRALAVARSVADAGVVPGAGAALRARARAREAGMTQDPVAALVLAAACEPYRRIQLAAGRDSVETGDAVGTVEAPADSLATVRGALAHAGASAARYLAGI
jgi:hypothetical protein